jgi:hypothetical protein
MKEKIIEKVSTQHCIAAYIRGGVVLTLGLMGFDSNITSYGTEKCTAFTENESYELLCITVC